MAGPGARFPIGWPAYGNRPIHGKLTHAPQGLQAANVCKCGMVQLGVVGFGARAFPQGRARRRSVPIC
eukprot:365383-Chlamydomonas_euryale.AAC.2